jgi:hypothetical protein
LAPPAGCAAPEAVDEEAGRERPDGPADLVDNDDQRRDAEGDVEGLGVDGQRGRRDPVAQREREGRKIEGEEVLVGEQALAKALGGEHEREYSGSIPTLRCL